MINNIRHLYAYLFTSCMKLTIIIDIPLLFGFLCILVLASLNSFLHIHEFVHEFHPYAENVLHGRRIVFSISLVLPMLKILDSRVLPRMAG